MSDQLAFTLDARGAGHRIPLPSRDDAIRARDESMARVEQGTDPEWAEYAFAFVAEYCRTHETMFPDDLWAAGLAAPREARAFGPIIQRAARCGMIVKSDEHRPRLRGHMTLAVVWRSNICGAESEIAARPVPSRNRPARNDATND